MQFTTTGTYYLWTRALSPDGDDDSYSYSIDGSPIIANAFDGTGALVWDVEAVQINTVGEVDLCIWMREDGALLEKFLLTTDSAFVPMGAGPPESSQGSGGTSSQLTSIAKPMPNLLSEINRSTGLLELSYEIALDVDPANVRLEESADLLHWSRSSARFGNFKESGKSSRTLTLSINPKAKSGNRYYRVRVTSGD